MANIGFMSSKHEFSTKPGHWALFALCKTLCLSAVSILFLVPQTAAAVGPHGGYSNKTDLCSTCHMVHTAKTKTLLSQSTATGTCLSCHSNGTGSDTAVNAGALMHPVNPGDPAPTVWPTLLGGGFMTVGNANPVTLGKHTLGISSHPHGNNNAGEAYQMECTSCHTPHFGPNYRLLRQRPGDAAGDISVPWNGPSTTATTDGNGVATTTTDNNYTEIDFSAGDPGASKEMTRNYKGNIATWCTTCHERYMTRVDATPFNTGDMIGNVARYRHAVDVPISKDTPDVVNSRVYKLTTDLPLQDLTGNGRTPDDTMTCLSCHRAHGTDATIGGEAVLPVAERGPLPAGEDAMLLRLNDRLVCKACHKVSV